VDIESLWFSLDAISGGWSGVEMMDALGRVWVGTVRPNA